MSSLKEWNSSPASLGEETADVEVNSVSSSSRSGVHRLVTWPGSRDQEDCAFHGKGRKGETTRGKEARTDGHVGGVQRSDLRSSGGKSRWQEDDRFSFPVKWNRLSEALRRLMMQEQVTWSQKETLPGYCISLSRRQWKLWCDEPTVWWKIRWD